MSQYVTYKSNTLIQACNAVNYCKLHVYQVYTLTNEFSSYSYILYGNILWNYVATQLHTYIIIAIYIIIACLKMHYIFLH